MHFAIASILNQCCMLALLQPYLAPVNMWMVTGISSCYPESYLLFAIYQQSWSKKSISQTHYLKVITSCNGLSIRQGETDGQVRELSPFIVWTKRIGVCNLSNFLYSSECPCSCLNSSSADIFPPMRSNRISQTPNSSYSYDEPYFHNPPHFKFKW
jgi:hypothetical protein